MIPFSNKKGPLWTAKLIHIVMLVAVFVFGHTIYLLLPDLSIKIFTPDDPILVVIEVMLGIIAILLIIFGYYYPRRFARKSNKTEYLYLSCHIIRVSSFEAVGIYGFVLGIIGAKWPITLPFLMVSIVALIFSFPTKEKWEKSKNNQGVL